MGTIVVGILIKELIHLSAVYERFPVLLGVIKRAVEKGGFRHIAVMINCPDADSMAISIERAIATNYFDVKEKIELSLYYYRKADVEGIHNVNKIEVETTEEFLKDLGRVIAVSPDLSEINDRSFSLESKLGLPILALGLDKKEEVWINI